MRVYKVIKQETGIIKQKCRDSKNAYLLIPALFRPLLAELLGRLAFMEYYGEVMG